MFVSFSCLSFQQYHCINVPFEFCEELLIYSRFLSTFIEEIFTKLTQHSPWEEWRIEKPYYEKTDKRYS